MEGATGREERINMMYTALHTMLAHLMKAKITVHELGAFDSAVTLPLGAHIGPYNDNEMPSANANAIPAIAGHRPRLKIGSLAPHLLTLLATVLEVVLRTRRWPANEEVAILLHPSLSCEWILKSLHV